MSDALTPKQVAEELGCSPDTVWRAIRNGTLPAVKTNFSTKARYRVKREVLENIKRQRMGESYEQAQSMAI